MSWYSEEDLLLRRYLLNTATAEERRRVEERLLGEEIIDSASTDAEEAELDYVDRLLLCEEELVDDYVRGALSEDERKLFERHFLISTAHRETLLLARAASEYALANPEVLTLQANEESLVTKTPEIVSKQMELPQKRHGGEWWQTFFAPKWQLAVIAALGVSLIFGGWWLWHGNSDTDRGMALLSHVCQENRLLQTRITELACVPAPTTRGIESDKQEIPQLDEAAALLHKAAREKADVRSLHALGRLYLVKMEFGKAKTQFEKALQLAPNDALVHADLGVALLEQSKVSLKAGARQESAVELGHGLDELDRAIELDRTLTPAYFNRALCRQLLGLNKLAEEGWKEYLERDSSSAWAEEARRNLKLLEEKVGQSILRQSQLFANFLEAYRTLDTEKGWDVFKTARLRAGNSITERLLTNWMEQAQQGKRDEMEGQLQTLAWIGKIEIQRVGDRYTTDLATYYKKSGAQNLAQLALARSAKAEGAEYYDKQDLTAAAAAFTKASLLFQKTGDICEASFAESWVGYCQTRLELVESSLSHFTKLIPLYRKKEYKNLLAYALHSTADTYTSRDEWSVSIDTAKQSLEIAEQIEDKLCKMRAQNTLASVNWMLGRYEESLAAGVEAIDLASQLTIDLKQVYGFYTSAVRNLASLEYQYAAKDVQQEAYYLAFQSGWPGLKSSSYTGLGMASSALGRNADAVNFAELALKETASLTDEKARNNQLAVTLFYQGHFLRRLGRHQEAVSCYQQAIALYEKNEFRFFAYKAYEGCFLALVALRNDAAAGAALREAVTLLEAFRRKIIEEDRRNSFFDTEQEFYDAAIEFELFHLNSETEAFKISEASRARSLLDAKQQPVQVLKRNQEIDLKIRPGASPLELREIQQKLAPNVRIVHYSVLSNKVVVWVIGSELFACSITEIEGLALEQKISSFVKLASTTDAGNQSATISARESLAAELYDVLIRPVKKHLNSESVVCLVPDKELNLLPFAALFCRETGKYFIEEQAFVVSPSSTAFVFCSESARHKKQAGQETFLGIGNPQLDLAESAREIKGIASLYRQPLLLLGAEAKKSVFLRRAPTADVIHIASHAIANERSPLLSKLMLAPDTPTEANAGDGALQAYELYELGPLQARLVILAACQTGSGRFWRGEGVMNLARPFISAGVPTVIVTLWNVDSEESAELMTAFHRYRKERNMNAADALRAAQLDGLQRASRSGKRDLTWAAYVATGSSLPGEMEQFRIEKGKTYGGTR